MDAILHDKVIVPLILRILGCRNHQLAGRNDVNENPNPVITWTKLTSYNYQPILTV